MGSGPAPVQGLVGRSAEWAQLDAALERLSRGGGSVVMIDGEAGIGKSTLLAATTRGAQRRGFRVLAGRCHEHGLAPVLWPWIEIVRQTGHAFDDVANGATIAEMATSILDVFAESSQAVPLVVVVDDVHWADADTIDVLGLVAASARTTPLLLAIAFRPITSGSPASFASGLATIGRAPGAVRVPVSGMSRADVALLIGDTAGRTATEDEADTVLRRTGGNPLFVTELTRFGGTRDVAGDVPDLVRDVVRSRVVQLPPRTQEILGYAAVLGEDLELRVVARAARITIDDCVTALEPAGDARMVIDSALSDVRFAHAIVREAMLVDMSPMRRARLHLAAADAIEAIYGADRDHREPIAIHRWEAQALDEPHRVTSALILAADTARRHGALMRAADLLEMAITAAERMAEGEARTALELETMENLLALETSRSFMTSGLDDVAARIEQLARRNRSDATIQLARFARWSDINAHPLRDVEHLALEAKQLADASDDAYVRVFGYYMWAVQRLLAGDIDEACPTFELALAARDALDPAGAARVRLSLGGLAATAFAVVGDADRALQILADERRFAVPQSLHPRLDVEAAFTWGLVGVTLADAAMTLRATAPVVAEPTAEDPMLAPGCHVMHGWAHAVLDPDHAGVELMEKALGRIDGGEVRVLLSMLRTLLGETLLRLGEPDDAVAVLEAAHAEAVERGEVFWLAHTERALAAARATLEG